MSVLEGLESAGVASLLQDAVVRALGCSGRSGFADDGKMCLAVALELEAMRPEQSQSRAERAGKMLLDNRCGSGDPWMEDRMMEAFTVLSGQETSTSLQVVLGAAVKWEDMEVVLRRIAAGLPDESQTEIREIWTAFKEFGFDVSFNDFMCLVSPVMAMLELKNALKEAFEKADEYETGFLSVENAMELYEDMKVSKSDHAAKKQRAKKLLEIVAEKEPQKQKYFPDGPRVSQESFLGIGILAISPLSGFSQKFTLIKGVSRDSP